MPMLWSAGPDWYTRQGDVPPAHAPTPPPLPAEPQQGSLCSGLAQPWAASWCLSAAILQPSGCSIAAFHVSLDLSKFAVVLSDSDFQEPVCLHKCPSMEAEEVGMDHVGGTAGAADLLHLSSSRQLQM